MLNEFSGNMLFPQSQLFSRFKNLVPKLRRKNEAKSEVTLIVRKNKVLCAGENERKFHEIYRNGVSNN